MISIITPTYNRGYCIKNLYDSLLEQTKKDFEWIIVDDGSADDTAEIVRGWIKECDIFPIFYYKQENGGKHRALNKGIQMAQGSYCFPVDSDDKLLPEAVQKIQKWIKEIDKDKSFAGVSGNKGSNRKSIIGEFPNNVEFVDAKNTERSKKRLRGDKAEIYRTELLKKYPFPEFEGEKFLPEQAVWDQIAKDGYKLRWHKDIIYLCQYQEDGLTRNMDKLIEKNIEGISYVYQNIFHSYPFPYNWTGAAAYLEIAKKVGITTKEIKRQIGINSLQYKVLVIVSKIWKIRKWTKRIFRGEINGRSKF